ncbi:MULTISPECIES: carbohydrate ABC transporter permease [Streptomycetaceae]|uniref:Binding-protein-dependent transport systems inner membrane component n=1 Tax=Streptantibioticus cattleyicolor (strain ATCC 35852 / DSM 46488 / JCM 4925 / NBRC 14057 / NRRL 8057) TaxID=1003195 RepID=F8K1W8_STREN|nr:sugar ABC transporter permease [Streptantibioticus cattleyicolor]AEW92441.1 binding-protein-dependent transport systems inner membrane component [Streptantibioticus cattleyicolor NRRL 8057 = DSM 46488]MYS57250.1 ABC transporter permease subunit [Streptomyces sp. SID5468]CCB72807.1 Carbohydrate ABC transporter membrane protein 1, CUT1 family [Streptantibioticus cattleyicolor NRRL 8057 = DSM 46488]
MAVSATAARGSGPQPPPPAGPAPHHPPPPARPTWRGRLYRLDVRLTPYLFVAPFFLLFAAFGVFPLVWTGWTSLHSVSTLAPNEMTWTGLDNYTSLLHDQVFLKSLRNTFTIGVLSAVPQLLAAIGLAHLLNYRLRGRAFFRVALLAPYATSVAAAALIFQFIFQQDDAGFVNWVLHWFGVPPVAWQAGSWSSQLAVSAIVIWRWTGYNTLIYLAAMQAVPQELYEAASIDGANCWQQFRRVTVPALRPTILFTAIISAIGSLQLFGEPYLFGGSQLGINGGPDNQYSTLALYVYRLAFSSEHLGRAAAVAWVIFFLAVLIGAANAVAVRLRRGRAGGRT